MFAPAPDTILSCTSGTLKVEDPSPVPYVVPIKANNAAYVVLFKADPSHNCHPVGAELFGDEVPEIQDETEVTNELETEVEPQEEEEPDETVN